MNKLFIIKVKSCFKEIKNKKEIMTRAEKTKTKFIKRNSFNFKHIKINFCYDNHDNRDNRDEQNNKK